MPLKDVMYDTALAAEIAPRLTEDPRRFLSLHPAIYRVLVRDVMPEDAGKVRPRISEPINAILAEWMVRHGLLKRDAKRGLIVAPKVDDLLEE